MPKPVRITGRISSVTNSFVNGIIPVVPPTHDQIDQALGILGMVEAVCAYCGGVATEWDHLRPLVVNKQPTGYISEIHNLVPACGKCNQSKGNKNWREWLFSSAPRSPKSRGVPDLDSRVSRLDEFERWGSPTRVDFTAMVGQDLWDAHWRNHEAIVLLMRDAETVADKIRVRIADSRSNLEAPEPDSAPDNQI